MMLPVEIFAWGFSGSLAVEIVSIYGYLSKDSNKLPDRYKKVLFWFIRLLLAIVAGGLAMAYKIENPILAINIGAATPLIIQALAKNTPEI
jgi:hypothetical protein